MKKLLTGLALSALVLGACGNGGEKQATDTKFNDPGREAFANSSCIGCHGKDLEGGSEPNLTKVGSKYSEQEILKIIQNGKGAMPKNLVEGKDAENIAKYLSKQK
ncbi:cytochrome c551 [Macrococcus capreoli]|uniref:cytochrome c551 n=1 Tax=Macrococcus capreoli TaxID=2982690 RepID=UPI0021D60292|nr:cytochrome c [Macrococcus sp. TMW 2.2395]MCU7556309.1 cytochrome c [Macrococcus sp. TMW 2.2395]